MNRITAITGKVQFGYPRRWWEFWKSGWFKHTDGFGTACWIHFRWPKEEDVKEGESRCSSANPVE